MQASSHSGLPWGLGELLSAQSQGVQVNDIVPRLLDLKNGPRKGLQLVVITMDGQCVVFRSLKIQGINRNGAF